MSRGRRRGSFAAWKWLIGAFVILVIGMTWHNGSKLFSSSDADHAWEAVERFYKFEQVGDFGSSWELFHPLMKDRFEKASYIQKRAHIVMQDFASRRSSLKLELQNVSKIGK